MKSSISNAIGVALLTAPAASQSWPSQTVTVIAPFAPGGIADIAANTVSSLRRSE